MYRLIPILLNIVLLTFSMHAYAKSSKHSATAEMFSEGAVLDLKLTAVNLQKQGKMRPAVASCLAKLKGDLLYDYYKGQLDKRLTKDEMSAADRYYGSVTGMKIRQVVKLKLYEHHHVTAKFDMPVETPDDVKTEESFMKTSAYVKLNHKNVMAEPAVREGAVVELRKSFLSCSLAK